jgi:hypothetical protein
MQLMELDRRLAVYPSTAAAAATPSGPDLRTHPAGTQPGLAQPSSLAAWLISPPTTRGVLLA